ncbi:MAG: hypothetical protein PWQ22_73 [Archaeoglobaceae archaeon]|nr:hypothetical protein [Archaeoglobaceae archaeon]MDK2875663.1 hypothetical protein [Archaeoglobaceae archaeon]
MKPAMLRIIHSTKITRKIPTPKIKAGFMGSAELKPDTSTRDKRPNKRMDVAKIYISAPVLILLKPFTNSFIG